MRRLILLLFAASLAFAQETQPLRVGDDVKAPVVITKVDAQYTPEARAQRIMGVVIVESRIDREGNVKDVHVLKGLPGGLDQAAVDAVKQWKFQPATLDGKPVEVFYNLVINFQLTAGPTTVILVRHAEKAVPGAGMNEDPPLSAAGEERARELAHVLGDVQLDAIYTTPYTRTRNTAAPIAKKRGLTPEEVKVDKDYAQTMAAIVKTKHSGDTVLIVGHSNTTSNVISALGVQTVPTIEDADYDNLFIVTIPEQGKPTMVRLHYGN